jgi:hypothetical protein
VPRSELHRDVRSESVLGTWNRNYRSELRTSDLDMWCGACADNHAAVSSNTAMYERAPKLHLYETFSFTDSAYFVVNRGRILLGGPGGFDCRLVCQKRKL